MMPAPFFYIVTEALRPDAAVQGGFSPSDWVIYAPVAAVIVAIIVPVGIARRERKAARLREELKEVEPLLVKMGVIASQARDRVSLDRDAIDLAELDRIQWQLADFSDRCAPVLGDALRTVVAAAAKLRQIAHLPPALVPSAIGARAVEQYRVAVELHEAISAAWFVIRAQRGSRS